MDGVHCSFNLATGNVTVGSGLVGHDQRDCFKLKAGSSLAMQVRARTKFKQLTAAAAAAAAASQDDAAVPHVEASQRLSEPQAQPPSEPSSELHPLSEQQPPSEVPPPSEVQPPTDPQLPSGPQPLSRGQPPSEPKPPCKRQLHRVGPGAAEELRRTETKLRAIEQQQNDAKNATRERNRAAREADREPCLSHTGGRAGGVCAAESLFHVCHLDLHGCVSVSHTAVNE